MGFNGAADRDQRKVRDIVPECLEGRASTGPLIEISGKGQVADLDKGWGHRGASTGPLIEISGKYTTPAATTTRLRTLQQGR